MEIVLIILTVLLAVYLAYRVLLVVIDASIGEIEIELSDNDIKDILNLREV